jgi:hypothetical protein
MIGGIVERLLAGLGVVLLAALLLEWRGGLLSIRSAAVDATALPPAAPADATATRTADDGADQALARPLFSPDRRAAAGTAGARAGGPSGPSLRSRLVGLSVSGVVAEALFADPLRNEVVTAHQGDTVEGWTIERIEPQRVILTQGALRLAVEPVGDRQPSSTVVLPPDAEAPAGRPAVQK